MIGQDAVTTAQAFLDGVGFDGVVLTKLDGDARGGAALSVAQVTGRQVMFASNGEKLDDFDVFHPDRMASRILGMGDMLTLIEQAEKAFDAGRGREDGPQADGPGTSSRSTTSWTRWSRSARWARSPRCSACCPAWAEMKQQINQVDDKDVDRVAGDHPVDDPGRAAPTRRSSTAPGAQRIAKGSGVRRQRGQQPVERFFEAQKMMSRWAAAGCRACPACPASAPATVAG